MLNKKYTVWEYDTDGTVNAHLFEETTYALSYISMAQAAGRDVSSIIESTLAAVEAVVEVVVDTVVDTVVDAATNVARIATRATEDAVATVRQWGCRVVGAVTRTSQAVVECNARYRQWLKSYTVLTSK